MGVLYVALGGALGAVTRYGVVNMSEKLWGLAFPYGVCLVNIIGSFLIGYVMSMLLHVDTKHSYLFLVTGMLGGFTTFSAFSYDTLLLLQRGEMVMALVYVIVSVVLSLGAVALGYYGMRIFG